MKLRLTCLFVVTTFLCVGQNWQWAKSGDYSVGNGYSVCSDSSGNVYTAGSFSTANIVFGSYTLNLNNPGGVSVFLTKYDKNGNVVWATSTIGSGEALSVCTDKSGNIFVCGWYGGTTMVFGSYTITDVGSFDAFIAKYDTNGNVLWAKTSLGSTGGDIANSICTDTSGNCYVAGTFEGTPFTSFGSYTLTNTGNINTFISKFDPSGNVMWAQCSNGYESRGFSICTDINTNIFVTGKYFGTSSFGSYTLANASQPSTFISKYDSNGNALWAKNAKGSNGSNGDVGYSVIADPNGNSYITGYFTSPTVSFTPYILTNSGSNGNWNLFLTKYDPNGNVVWVKQGKGYSTAGYSLAYKNGCIYLAGCFIDTLVINTNTIIAPAGSSIPMVISRLDLNGNVNYLSCLKSGGFEKNAISVDDSSNAYIAASFYANPNFVVGTNTLIATAYKNSFVAKLSFSTNCQSIPNAIYTVQNPESPFLLSPIPTDGILNITFNIDGLDKEFTKVEIFNSIGQRVTEIELFCNNKQTKIDLKYLPNGVYLLNLKGNNAQTISKRFVIAK